MLKTMLHPSCRFWESAILVFTIYLFQLYECSDLDDDMVNTKALSELHPNLRKPKYDRTYGSSGDGEVFYDDSVQPTSSRNLIENFLLAQKLKNNAKTTAAYEWEDPDPTMTPFYEEGTAQEVIEEEVVYEEVEPEYEYVEEEEEVETTTRKVVNSKKVYKKKGRLRIDGSRIENNATEAAAKEAYLHNKRPRVSTLTCFECYACKTYFLRKIRRCPRGLDMCVKEVSVGRRVAINGRNLIDLEINQYCSTGECPRNDGNITYACCRMNLCNSSGDTGSMVNRLILLLGVITVKLTYCL